MIRLENATLREMRLPLVEPFGTAAGVVADRRVLLLNLTDGDGREVWSECVAESRPSYSPETIDTCWLALAEWILPFVLGQTFANPNLVHHALDARVRGHNMARASVEMGMWALTSVSREMSLASLLCEEAAREANGPAHPREFVEAGIALGVHASPPKLADRVKRAAADGYRRIKIKIAPGFDVDYARAAREVLGPSFALSVDANGSYSLSDAAHVTALESLDQLGLSMIEQPLAHDDLVQHAELQRRLSTRLCLDESIPGAAAAENMLALGSARVLNVKPGRVGGFQQALAIHDMCAGAGTPVWCGGMLESGIGRAYNVALASLPNFTEPGDLSPSSRYWARDVIKTPWTMDSSGCVQVPLSKPGLGVEADIDFIDNITVREGSFDAR